MNREDQDFDQLRRLLKLKRHEQPPPRYFNDFSTHLLTRLELVSADQSNNWFKRLWGALELKPLVPAGFGAAVCGLLVAGAVYTEANPGSRIPNFALTDSGAGTRMNPNTIVPLERAQEVVLAFSTNPVPSSSLFDQIPLGMQPRKLVDYHPLFR